jgi:hypothetical protein
VSRGNGSVNGAAAGNGRASVARGGSSVSGQGSNSAEVSASR